MSVHIITITKLAANILNAAVCIITSCVLVYYQNKVANILHTIHD